MTTECDNEEAEIARAYLHSALDIPIAYLHNSYPDDDSALPLDMGFYWDEPGFGVVATSNMAEGFLEAFRDDPEKYAKKMPVVVAELRMLADQIEALYPSNLS